MSSKNLLQQEDSDSLSSFEKISLHDDNATVDTRDSPSDSGADSAPPPPPDTTAPAAAPAPQALSREIEEDEHLPSTSDNTASTSRNSHTYHKGDPVMRELEEAATVAAVAAKEAAAIAQEKLTRGVAEAKTFFSSLWSSFDDATGGGGGSGTGKAKDEEALRQRLGLEQDEQILEIFRCKLLQVYHAANGFTPTKTIAFSGQLTIATASVCFDIDSAAADGRPAVRVPRSDLRSFSRIEGDCIQLKLGSGDKDKEMVVGQFSFPRLEVDSALGLLEQLVAGDGSSG